MTLKALGSSIMHKLFKLASVALVSASLAGTALEAGNIVSNTGTVSAAKKKAKTLTSGKTVKLTDINLKITKWAVIPVGATGNEDGDKPVIAFWYDVKNKTGKDIDPISAWLAVFNAYQDTSKTQVNELDVASLPDQQFLGSQTESIKKGATAKNAIAYSLDDETTPVVLKAIKGYDGKLLAKQTIKIQSALEKAKASSTTDPNAPVQ
ncbi:DUF5067 domain-containing protein [Weissella confusa]|nr:DUF5067 domain-containing protein [Weissella confusa]